jgi:hypothetical protein
MPKPKAAPSNGQGQQPFLPGWEQLTHEQQQALISLLADAAETIRDQYDAELERLEQHAAAGRLLASRDGAGIGRVPIPPVPDIKRDGAYEKLALDLHRLGTILAYLEAALAYLAAQGYDIGVSLAQYTHARTEGLAEGSRVKAYARTLEEQARQAYMSLYSRVVHTFPERAMQRVGDWDEQSRQSDSLWDRLRRLWGEHV